MKNYELKIVRHYEEQSDEVIQKINPSFFLDCHAPFVETKKI